MTQGGMTTFPEFDIILQVTGLILIVLFVLFVVIFFFRTLFRDGIGSAFVRLFSFQVIIPFLLVLAFNLLSFSIVFIRPQQVGVVVSLISPGGVRPQTLPGGLHLIIPFIERVQKYPIYWQTYTMSSSYNEGNKPGDDSIRARTSDGQEVRLDCSLIFRVNAEQAVLVHIDWQNRYAEELVRPVMRGIVRTQVSQFTVEEVNSSARRDLEASLERLLDEELSSKGFILDQFLVRDIAFTPEYALSVEQKQVALEEQIKAEYEAERLRRLARGQADAVLIQANAQAEALELIGEAIATNRDILTYEYINKLTPNIRVMLVPNNAPLILPLDGLIDGTDAMTPTDTMTGTMPMGTPDTTLTTGAGFNP